MTTTHTAADEPAYLLAARSNVRADAPTSPAIVRLLLAALDARPARS